MSQLAFVNPKFVDGGFMLESVDGDVQVVITSDLELDPSSANYRYLIMPLARSGLRENQIFDVLLRSGEDRRIGWLIPANALSSKEHADAENVHFLRYAYAAIREVLTGHVELYVNQLRQALQAGENSVPFSSLFHDNMSFLVICLDLAEHFGQFEPSRLIPSLVSFGYVPINYCEPELVDWNCRDLDEGVRHLTLSPTGSGIARPDLPAKLFSLAATSPTSTVTQFFYLYQVVELLLEEVLQAELESIGRAVSGSIQSGQTSELRDHLEGLSQQLSEKYRLGVLMSSFDGADGAVKDVGIAADAFLQRVGARPKQGIAGLYQVRNFVIHQVRNMPEDAEELLRAVVVELATFLPKVLSTFKITPQASSAISG